jgi:GntR family transcriptional regulator/MocR family aminotransferase
MLISLNGAAPLQRQIYEQVKGLVLGGAAAPGTRLTSSRELASELGISRNTVLIAYEQLAAEGYIHSRHGTGTFIADALRRVDGGAAARVETGHRYQPSGYGERLARLDMQGLGRRVTFAYNFRDSVISADDFPVAMWRRLLLAELRRRSRVPATYEDPQGLPDLRAALCDYLLRARAVRAEPDQLLIVNGTQQALDLAVRVLVDPGAPVVVEDPGYPGARLAFAAAGARLLRVPVDEDGLDTARLPAAETRTRLAYITPSHQFPVGSTMPASRRLALLDWADRSGAYIFEDDYDSEFRYSSRTVEAVRALDRADGVIYAGSASKALSPGLRLGYVVLPRELVEPFLRAKQLSDWYSAPLDQAVFARLIQEGHFERHLRRTRRRNQRRRDCLIDALAATFGAGVTIRGVNAGLHVSAWFAAIAADQAERVAAAAAARSVGIELIPAAEHGPWREAGFVLRYAGLDEAVIRHGVGLLGEAVRAVSQGGAETDSSGSPTRDRLSRRSRRRAAASSA